MGRARDHGAPRIDRRIRDRRCAVVYLGAGAIIDALPGIRSIEAAAAADSFARLGAGELHRTIAACSSGVELLNRGFECDVELAAQLDVSECVPIFNGTRYTRLATTRETGSDDGA